MELRFSISASIKYRKHVRHTLEGVAGVSRLGCTHTLMILSTGMLMHSHTEDLAEAARIQAVCTQERRIQTLFTSGYMHGQGLWQHMQGWKAV